MYLCLAEAGVKSGQAVVVSRQILILGGVEGVWGGRTDGGGIKYGRDRDIHGLNRGDDTVSNLILGM